MKHGLDWKAVNRQELAEHLQSADILRSQALGESNLYHCRHTDGESIAIALPDGNGLIVGKTLPPTPERRKARRQAS